MRTLIQVVSHAQVMIENQLVAQIDHGILVFVGIDSSDTPSIIERMAQRVLHYRVFTDASGRMNLNVQQAEAELLLVSQFTLVANTQSGNRPSFTQAMAPEPAQLLYQQFVDAVTYSYPRVKQGRFQAHMQVSLTNEGPVTFLLES